ncbi:serpin B [Bacteroides zoogleoformans]|uniref:Serpin family protein n=1 Tax=Bacteroides zoogleoformans TaxID=28119 RepID=A0ABN5IGC2_9BACE|nr:serpin family protein [Bacteroides zoogleoformans]AVM51764.1 serpin family protein [Bacteroides zoogleoformans]TWJ13806.1 serpin B [Bacteroides zoogleoformans]
MLKKTFAVFGLLCILASCQNDESSSPQPQPRKDIALTRTEQEMLDKGNDFAFRFFSQVCKTEEKPNLFVSPLSVTLCLSMVTNGAAGNTLEEMKTTLGFSDYSLDKMNDYNKKLVTALLDLDNTTRLGIANSIWIRQGFGVYDDFVNVNKRMYDAQVRELDFASPAAIATINNWCAEKTNNCITEVLTEIPDAACLYLLNALYFKGNWTKRFSKSDTASEQFTNGDGSKSAVQMMNMNEGHFNYGENEYFSIAEFPYGNEAFSMVVLLPAEGKSLEECLPQLTKEHWLEWSKYLSGATLNVKFPRFELKYDKKLKTVMMAMGMKDAFDRVTADFSKMSAAHLFVGLLEQYTYVKVDEEGTEAAAVTVTGMLTTSIGTSVKSFHINRPFVFLIKEKSTGTILFMGKVTAL